MTSPPRAPAATPLCILDSQSVLDWLYFADPVCAPWEDWRQQGRWQWLASRAMQAELAHVLARGHLPPARFMTGPELLRFMDDAVLWVEPELESAPTGMRCKDRDDQKFINLALQSRCTWLVSRDKAVLKLARKLAAAAGCQVFQPARWLPPALLNHPD